MVVIGATTYGIGHFGDVSVAIFARAHGVQVVGAMVTAFTLILTALFAERECAELALAERNAQFNLARYAARVSTYVLQQNLKNHAAVRGERSNLRPSSQYHRNDCR